VKNFRPIICLVCLILVMSAGCKQQAGDRKITLRYMSYEYLPSQVVIHKAIVDDFNKSQKRIFVKLETEQKAEQKILTQIAGGTAPDIIMWFNSNVYDLARKSALVEMTPYLKESKINEEDYFPGMFSSMKINLGNNLYAFPMSWGAEALAYNQDLFDRAGVAYPNDKWTWDDFVRAAQKLTIAQGGRFVQYGSTLPTDGNVLLSFGTQRFDEKLTRCTLDSPEARQAFQFLVDLNSKYKVIPNVASLPRAEQWQTAMDMFQTGKVAMYITSSFQLQALSKSSKFRWDIAPIPRHDDQKRLTAPGINGLAISTQSKYPKEAWEFIKFVCGPEGEKYLGKNCIPAHKATAEKYTLIPPPAHIKILVNQFEGTAVFAEGYTSWGREYVESVYRQELDKMLLGLQSVAETTRKMTAEGNKFLEQQRK